MNSKPRTIIMIGNPGVGKSTLLNALLGEVRFKSGISYGKGLTTQLAMETKNGIRLIDTPGLSDVEARSKTAKEIEEALKKGGEFRVFFIVTLEDGRIKPEDKTTMKLVLDAAPEIGQRYSIIINKAKKRYLKDLVRGSSAYDSPLALFNIGLPGTDTLFLNPFDEDLDGVDDALVKLQDELKGFILHRAPAVEIHANNVNPIASDLFEKERQKHAAERERFLNEIKYQDEMIAESQNKREEAKKAPLTIWDIGLMVGTILGGFATGGTGFILGGTVLATKKAFNWGFRV